MTLYRLVSYNPHTKEKCYSQDALPQWLVEQTAAALNRMPAMVREGLTYSAEPLAEQATRPSYKARQRGEQ